MWLLVGLDDMMHAHNIALSLMSASDIPISRIVRICERVIKSVGIFMHVHVHCIGKVVADFALYRF